MTQARSNASVLFLGKAGDPFSERALAFCRLAFTDVSGHLSSWGDPMPDAVQQWEGDYIVSYLSRWIIKNPLLGRARKAAINFHPASPDYPGIGCNNFALYDDADEYGATCHHMDETVDTGALIAVRRFPVFPDDDVASILARTYDHMFQLFLEVLGGIAKGDPMPEEPGGWTRRPYTRKEFDALFEIRPDMSEDEVRRRVRAVSYGKYQPYVRVAGRKFLYAPGEPA